MAFSLQTLAESALLVAPATVVSAYIGARIQSYVDRPRVSASILTCRLPKGEELDSYKIEVDDELSRMLRNQHGSQHCKVLFLPKKLLIVLIEVTR